MPERRKFVKRDTQAIVAVQLKLDTPGFSYQKWGGEQRCKPGDWLVDNGGDVYTVDGETFARTYEAIGLGTYRKVAPVWAEQAAEGGVIATKEGRTHYEAGDYVVFNEERGGDGYAVSRERFEEMYEEMK